MIRQLQRIRRTLCSLLLEGNHLTLGMEGGRYAWMGPNLSDYRPRRGRAGVQRRRGHRDLDRAGTLRRVPGALYGLARPWLPRQLGPAALPAIRVSPHGGLWYTLLESAAFFRHLSEPSPGPAAPRASVSRIRRNVAG